jgi:hypothetical protein
MTEQEWLSATEPTAMLEFLRGKASDRKLRLFACGCCRRMWHLLKEPKERMAVEIGELLADDGVSLIEIEVIRQHIDWRERGAAKYAVYANANGAAEVMVMEVARALTDEAAVAEVRRTLNEEGETADEAFTAGEEAYKSTVAAVGRLEKASNAHLIRCIFGNPFHPISINPSWLTSTVLALANCIYEERAFDRMPILADALQDAGCDNEEILKHCRGPGPHVRGCFLLDLLLGKE